PPSRPGLAPCPPENTRPQVIRRMITTGAAVLTICGGASSGWCAAGDAHSRLLPAGTLRVAILVPHNGYFSTHNALIEKGARVATDEINAHGGIAGTVKIDLVPRPLEGDASPVQVMDGLRSTSTKAVILPCDVDSTASLAKAGSRLGLLMMLPCNPDAKLGSKYPTLWPVGMAGNEQVAQLVNFASRENSS